MKKVFKNMIPLIKKANALWEESSKHRDISIKMQEESADIINEVLNRLTEVGKVSYKDTPRIDFILDDNSSSMVGVMIYWNYMGTQKCASFFIKDYS